MYLSNLPSLNRKDGLCRPSFLFLKKNNVKKEYGYQTYQYLYPFLSSAS